MPLSLGVTEFSRRVGAFTLTESVYEPGTRLSRHEHEQPAVSLMLEGRHAQDYGARGVWECGALEAMIEPGGAVHRNHFPVPGRTFILAVETPLVRTFGSVARFFDAPRVVPGGGLRDAALALHRASRDAGAAAELLIEALAFELLAHVVRIGEGEAGRGAPRWLRAARDELHSDFNRGVSLSRVAERAGVHPVYLARAFRRFYGCSPGEYVRRLRIEFAARLLLTSDAPASRVALESGFSDQSHFTRAFKRHTGQTPARFRASARG
jgi:AraC family transcriptional regulator